MLARLNSILRKSYAIIALLMVVALGLVAAPPSKSEQAIAAERGSTGYLQAGALVPPMFGPNVRANSDTTVFGQHEPGLAVSRTDPNVVVAAAKDYRNGNVKRVWIYVSTDGGATWPASRQLQMPGTPADVPIQSDPVVMARDDGRIYVSALVTNDSQNRGGIYITWTDDNGATWRNPSVPVFYPENALDDKEWFAIDNNPASPYYHRMYMMYAPSASYIVTHYSTDGGETWSARQTISATDTEYTYPVVASDGTVYNFMMLHWGAGRVGTVQLTKSTNGGVTWSAPSTVATAQQPAYNIRSGDAFRFFAILSAAVDPADTDPNTRDLYVAWTDNRNFATNGVDVVYVKSSNGGQTWGPVTRLSHDPTGVVRDHITPMVVVGADSRVHAFWLDRRLDPNNRFFDSWYSSSTDGGATWDPDTRVSTVSQDLNVGFPPGSGNAAGDYWGLDVSGNSVYVAWNDTRSGDQDILVSRGLLSGGATATPTAPLPSPTRTTTPHVSVTSTIGAFCPVTAAGASTSCTPPSTYNYSFQFNGTCGIGGNATLRFEVAQSSGGPWTLYDSQTFRVYFYTGPNTVQGTLSESGIPPQYSWYRVTISILMDDGLTTNNATSATPLCSAGSTPTGTVAPATSTSTATATQTPECDMSQRYADVPPDNAFYNHINYMTCLGIMSGYECGSPGEPCDSNNTPYFRHGNSITRGQLSKIVSNAAGIADDPGARVYEDVPADNVFYPYVQRLTNRGVMSGYPCGALEEPCVSPGNRPYFRPNAQATRGQISKIVANAAGLGGNPTGQTFEDVPPTHTFYLPIERLASLGVMGGYPCGSLGEPCVSPGNRPYFRPNATATRGQTSKIVANTFFVGCCEGR